MRKDLVNANGDIVSQQRGSPSGAGHAAETGVAAGLSDSRRIAALAGTRKSRTWTEAVTEVTVHCFQEAAGTANLGASVGITFDAASDLDADGALVHSDVTAQDRMETMSAGETRTFYFDEDGITRIDAIRLYGSENLGLSISAGRSQ